MSVGAESERRDLLSTGQVAQLIGSSRQHIVNMCSRGELPVVWIGRHRRIHRSSVDALLDVARGELTRDQERSLWLHRAVAGVLMAEPEKVLEHARKNLRRLRQRHRPTGMTAHWLDEWRAVVDRGVDETANVLTSSSPAATEMRQNSPFAGVLPDKERSRVLAAFVRHRSREHAAADA